EVPALHHRCDERIRKGLHMRKKFVPTISGLALVFAAALVVHAQQSTTPKPDTKSSSMGASPDQHFVMEAAKGGMAEVELGQLAADKASNPKVKEFGQRMATDHGKANDELKSLAAKKNITLPTLPDTKQKATHDKLASHTGAEFDRAYMKDMLADHRKDV